MLFAQLAIFAFGTFVRKCRVFQNVAGLVKNDKYTKVLMQNFDNNRLFLFNRLDLLELIYHKLLNYGNKFLLLSLFRWVMTGESNFSHQEYRAAFSTRIQWLFLNLMLYMWKFHRSSSLRWYDKVQLVTILPSLY